MRTEPISLRSSWAPVTGIARGSPSQIVPTCSWWDHLGPTQNRTIELIHKEGDEEAASSKLIDDPDFTDKLTEKVRKTFGLFLSLLSGLLYGANFFPITLSVEKDYFYSHLDATFSHFTGILGSHLIYFIIYSVYTHVSLPSWPQMTPKDLNFMTSNSEFATTFSTSCLARCLYWCHMGYCILLLALCEPGPWWTRDLSNIGNSSICARLCNWDLFLQRSHW